MKHPKPKMRARFVCRVCGKRTAGRLPRASRHEPGDGSFWYPRRHKVDGRPCMGSTEEAVIITEPAPERKEKR